MQQQLLNILGDQGLDTNQAKRSLYSQDVFREGELAEFVARPANIEQLQRLVTLAVEQGYALVPRGGGMSYTEGILPVSQKSVVVDMSAMNRVLEINAEDMTVTVEAGCTWSDLNQALQPSGLRTPYWGTLSGIKATVGGSVSQNSIFWGSGQYGTAADNVIGMEIVIADGSVLVTGSASQRNSTPFMRQFGPDLTGLFTSDCSALGIKARITLRLVPVRQHKRFVSASFTSFADMQKSMSAVSRTELASECFGFDPFLQSQRMRRESLAKDVQALTGVMKSAGGIGKALKEGAKVALAGRNFIDEQDWSVHYIVEDHSEAGAAAREATMLELIRSNGGKVVENTIPKVLNGHPFGPVNNMVGPEGERWVPVHALVPHSKAQRVYALTEEIFDRHRAAIEQYGIGTGYLLAVVSTSVFVLEPVFFWPDELKALHRDSLEPAHLKKLKGFAENLEARAAVTTIRKELAAAYSELGASHLQLGKSYHYQQGLRPESLALVTALKQQLDPQCIMNPGVLGFGGA
jgi:glycolate dehydrogenase FAD-linked subunit